jgi:hypothetical protein
MNPKKGKLVHTGGDFEVSDNFVEGCRAIRFGNLFDTAMVDCLHVRGHPDGQVFMLLFMNFGDDKQAEDTTKAVFRDHDIVPDFKTANDSDNACFRTSPAVVGQMTALLKVIDVLVGVPESHRKWLFDLAENPSKYCPKMTEEENAKLEAGKKRRYEENEREAAPLRGLMGLLGAMKRDGDGEPKAKAFRL